MFGRTSRRDASRALTAVLCSTERLQELVQTFVCCTGNFSFLFSTMVQQPDTWEAKWNRDRQKNLHRTKMKQMLMLYDIEHRHTHDPTSFSLLMRKEWTKDRNIWSAWLLWRELSLPSWHFSHSFRDATFSHTSETSTDRHRACSSWSEVILSFSSSISLFGVCFAVFLLLNDVKR